MTTKDAIYRHLIGLSKAGTLSVPITHIHQDMRPEPDSARSSSSYPYLIFRRITASEDNQVKYARERVEIEVVGLAGSAASNDDVLEGIRTELLTAFSGVHKTFGQYDASGNPDSNTGLRMRCSYVSTVEGFGEDLKEKGQIHIWLFTHLRG